MRSWLSALGALFALAGVVRVVIGKDAVEVTGGHCLSRTGIFIY